LLESLKSIIRKRPSSASARRHNVGNPLAPLYYRVSMHCLTISLAEGGAGLGTVWGIETARRMLAEAGFPNVEVLDSPRPHLRLSPLTKVQANSNAGCCAGRRVLS
jgi:hypothetical protein